MSEDLARAIGPDRRTFVKRLVIGTAFAAPIVSTFKMSGIGAIFGDVPKSTTMGSNSNTTPPTGLPGYDEQLVCGVVDGKGGLELGATDGAVTITVLVLGGSLPDGTILCIYKGDLTDLASEVPTGSTPVSAYGVVWNSPPGNTQPDASQPITMVVTDATVKAGDSIYAFDKTSGEPVLQGTATVAGAYTVTFTEDPGIVVTTPSATGGGTDAGAADAIDAQATTTG